MNFISSVAGINEKAFIAEVVNKKAYAKGDNYLDELLNLAVNNSNKTILSQRKGKIVKYSKLDNNLKVLDKNDILSRDLKTRFSQYTLPIMGEKYIVQIDRGISVFGENSKTRQSLISIYDNEGRTRITFKESQLERIV